MNDSRQPRSRSGAYLLLPIALIMYLLSSGPVIGLGFWLREATKWDAWYGVMWLYYPLFVVGTPYPLGAYIDWWVVDVFDTVGPG